MILIKSPKKSYRFWHIANYSNKVKTLCKLVLPINYLDVHYPNHKVKICHECQKLADIEWGIK